jgi:hypothetical protein
MMSFGTSEDMIAEAAKLRFDSSRKGQEDVGRKDRCLNEVRSTRERAKGGFIEHSVYECL